MPSMDWEDFQRDHHRPHVLIVSMKAKKPKHALGKADFMRFLVVVGAGLLALVLVGLITAATMAEFWANA